MNEVIIAVVGALGTVIAAWLGNRQARKSSRKPTSTPIYRDPWARVLAIAAIGIGLTGLMIALLPALAGSKQPAAPLKLHFLKAQEFHELWHGMMSNDSKSQPSPAVESIGTLIGWY